MPEISMFGGIRITMYYDDHNPPHFHADYAGNRALIDIQDELMQNWELARSALPLRSITPLM